MSAVPVAQVRPCPVPTPIVVRKSDDPPTGPLDFATYATSLDACLERSTSVDLTRWLKAAEGLPSPLRPFLWFVVDTTLSRAAKDRLQSHPLGSRILVQGSCQPRLPKTRPAFQMPQQAFDGYAAVYRKFGSIAAVRDLDLGRVVALAIRNQSSTLAHHGKGSYDDQIVVLQSLGRWGRAAVFPICTEPGAQYSQRAAPVAGGGRKDPRYAGVGFKKADGSDIDKDGIKDAGRLVAGTYRYFEKKGGHLKARAFQVKVTQVAERDTDGDGRFTRNDPSSIDKTGAYTSMYIHQGGADNVLEPNTWSAGCQTIPKNRYPGFLKLLPAPASFYYVLVNATS